MRIRETIKKANPVLVDLIAGCLIYLIIGELAIVTVIPLLVESDMIKIAVGFLLGVCLMIAQCFHMHAGILNSFGLNESEAIKHNVKNFIIRASAVFVIFLIIYFTRIVNAIAMVIGMISLKVAAYLQPITHKYVVTKIIK